MDQKNNKDAKKYVSNVAKLDAEHPIPFEVKGLSHIAENSYRYIPFLGDTDNFFETLAETKKLSPTCDACVNSKVKYSVGTGWTFNDESIDNEFMKIAKRMNKRGESLDVIIKKVFANYYTSGNCFINIVKVTVGSKSKIHVYVKNNFDSRLAYTDDPDVVTHVIFSSQFRSNQGYTRITSDQVEVPLWIDSEVVPWKKDKNGNQHICIHIKNDDESLDHYGLPSNVSSLLQQQLEYKGARYNIDNFENNMVIGGILLLKSGMSETEALKHGKKIVDTHVGDGKRGRIMVMASEEDIDSAKFIPFERSSEGSYLELDKRAEEKIIVANEWDAALAGIPQGSTLGRGEGYLKEIFDVKYNTIIRPEQEKIIELFLTPLVYLLDQVNGTKFSSTQIDIKTPTPVSFGSSIDPNKVMTIREGRKYFPSLNEEDIDEETGRQIIDSHSKSQKNVSNQ